MIVKAYPRNLKALFLDLLKGNISDTINLG